MSHAANLTRHRRPAPAASPARPNIVNRSLTPNRATRPVENDEYAAFARRVLRAYSH